MKNYFIHPRYTPRLVNEDWDDTIIEPENMIENQRAVYEFARKIAVEQSSKRILDLGCGCGVKLVRYFPEPEFKTIGAELPKTLAYLISTYPERAWVDSSKFNDAPEADLVICADTIEHLSDPDVALDYIKRTKAMWLVISTPDRDSLDNHDGPPRNVCHVREWSMSEFNAYISSHFEVTHQFISSKLTIEFGGSTQVILCRI